MLTAQKQPKVSDNRDTNFSKLTPFFYYFVVVFKDMKEVNSMYFHWGECDDRHRNCEKWANNGLCEKDPKKMDHWCPWNCHKCAPETLGNTEDIFYID